LSWIELFQEQDVTSTTALPGFYREAVVDFLAGGGSYERAVSICGSDFRLGNQQIPHNFRLRDLSCRATDEWLQTIPYAAP
jgi:hypothetical protein